jgi:hypothetical protein
MSTVKTNKSDYKPGSKVLITAGDFSSGATIQFEVLNLGDDGVQGTADDFSYNAWAVTDGGRGDSDSAAGTVGTTWVVPGSALNSTLVLSAREAGSDGVFGTADDVVATRGRRGGGDLMKVRRRPDLLRATGSLRAVRPCYLLACSNAPAPRLGGQVAAETRQRRAT